MILLPQLTTLRKLLFPVTLLLSRDDIRTNLLESYDRLLAFGEKHLDDPFYSEREVRISLRSKILREVCANLLIHREFTNAFPAKLVPFTKYKDREYFRKEILNSLLAQGLLHPTLPEKPTSPKQKYYSGSFVKKFDSE